MDFVEVSTVFCNSCQSVNTKLQLIFLGKNFTDLTLYIFFFILAFENNDQKNPWIVGTLEDFSYFCCTECIYKSKEGLDYQNHMFEIHSQANLEHLEVKSEEEFSNDPNEVGCPQL